MPEVPLNGSTPINNIVTLLGDSTDEDTMKTALEELGGGCYSNQLPIDIYVCRTCGGLWVDIGQLLCH